MPYDLLVQRPVPVYSVNDYAKKQLNVFTSIHASVREKLQALRAEMTQRQHQRAHGIIIHIGDFLLFYLRKGKQKGKTKKPATRFSLQP